MSVTFYVPEVEIEVPAAELEPLRAELDSLASTRLGPGAEVIARQLVGPGARVDTSSATFEEFWALLRALDHLRNSGQTGAQAHRLRDSLVAGWVPYRLRQGAGGTETDFTSYSGMYLVGDRLVAGPDVEYRVEEIVVRETEPTILVVSKWRQPSE